jgi:8-oxo-dGTP pyrophosphatase MutT (NUDIX family)
MKEIQKFTVILFKLPNGKYVLQRRTKDAPHGAGMIGFFGGWVEEGETPDDCINRELKEETSLDSSLVKLLPAGDFILPASEHFPKDRHFFMYEAYINDLNFHVYEGDGAEAYALEELRERNDLISSAVHIVNNVL